MSSKIESMTAKTSEPEKTLAVRTVRAPESAEELRRRRAQIAAYI